MAVEKQKNKVAKKSSTKKVAVKKVLGKAVTAKIVAESRIPPEKTKKMKIVSHEMDPKTNRPILPEGYTPNLAETYMNMLHVEYFHQRLLQWRTELIEESKQTIEHLQDEVRDVGDDAERATRETENSLELRTRDRYRKLIGKIDSALVRIDAGDYGYSIESGEEIGLERLEARLTADRTLDEQERWEHLQRQLSH